jgi:hypothetical protein
MAQTREQVEAELQAYKDANNDWMNVKWKTNAVAGYNNRLASFPAAGAPFFPPSD